MDLRELRKIQRDTGFNPGFIEKVYQLTRILEAVYSDNNLKEYLALKGGTALNFIYLNIPRLSVDLDFNFVGALEKNKMLQLRPTVTDRIKVVADNLGFTTSKKPFSYILDRFLLRYRSLQGLRLYSYFPTISPGSVTLYLFDCCWSHRGAHIPTPKFGQEFPKLVIFWLRNMLALRAFLWGHGG